MLTLAVPLVFAESLELLMVFCDRWFLSHLGPEYTAASFVGGTTVWTLVSFLFGLTGYISALAGQYVGSGEPEKAGRVLFQGLWIAVASAPACWLLIPVGHWAFSVSGHPEKQIPLEQAYFTILLAGAFIGVANVSVSCFLSGIGRTRPVAVASIIGLLFNLPANYALIFGNWGFPALGVQGAAIATLLSEAVILVSMTGWLWKTQLKKYFSGRRMTQIQPDILKMLWRLGSFNGFDFFLQMAGFNLFLFFFTAYGEVPAASLSIVLTWESLFILPLFAAEIATMSLCGLYTGQDEPVRVRRAVNSSLQINLLYTGSLFVLLWLGAPMLVGVFVHKEGIDPAIESLGIEMMRGLGLYLLFNGISFAYSGGLKGAGDTRAPMIIAGTGLLIPALVCVVMVIYAPDSYLGVWWTFLVLSMIKSLAMMIRFLQGHWEKISLPFPEPN